MFDRFSENAKQVMARARKAALRQRHAAIEPEHVLLGALELPTCNAVVALRTLGIDTETLRHALDTLMPAGTERADADAQLPFTPAARRVLELTLEKAVERGDNHVGTQHLLLGIVAEGKNAAAEVLARAGVDDQKLALATAGTLSTSARSRLRLLLISNSTMHGGGYLEHCKAEIQDFLGKPKRVMFLPYALHDHDAYAAKAREAFAAMGHELSSTHEHRNLPGCLEHADCVFVGGGNTFRLLSALQHYGLLAAIQERALAGMPYVGSSAGTNVATLSIRTTNDMPIVQPPSFMALRLVPFQINPHYLDPDPGSRHMGETREERIRQFHEEHTVPVLGLREGCMLRVVGERMELRGTTNARLFRRDREPEEFAPPCDLSFLLQD